MIKKTLLLALLTVFIHGNLLSQSPNSFTYTGKPRFQILTKRNNIQLGIINVELFPNIAPKHTHNFDSLVSQVFYDTTAFHRVIPGFMIQGGDPNSRHGPKPTWGQGQFGQPTVNAEFSPAKHKRGILSAARSSNINSATSQFFICHAAAPHLDGSYSVYGRVTHGINWVDTIANAPRDGNDCPNTKIEMFITYIGSNDTVPVAPLLNKPVNDSIEIDTLLPTFLSWKTVNDAILYQVQCAKDPSFAVIDYTTTTGNLSFGVPAGLPGGTKYYWRARTNNGGHFSPWSQTWNFKTQMPFNDVGIKKNSLSVENGNVYPNPSNGKFTFADIPKGSRIEIYDSLGKLIFEASPKDSSVIVNLEGKEKGVYSYRILSESTTSKQGKIILK